jgi:hypothetical protein
MLKSLQEFFNDESRVLEMAKSMKMHADRRLNNMQRMKKFYQDEESFSALMERIIKKHDDRWRSICYAKSIEPYPWYILYSVYDIAEDEGVEVDAVDGLTENFPSFLVEYMGWVFAITHGQGSVLSIYKDKVLMYRD